MLPRAIAAGFVVDVVGTMVSGVFLLWLMAPRGLSPEGYAEWSHGNTSFLVVAFVVAVLWDVAGGYVAGCVAKANRLRHGTLLGIALTVFGVIVTLVSRPERHVEMASPFAEAYHAHTDWLGALGFGTSEVAALFVTAPAAALGSYLASRRRSDGAPQ
jgi:hypothetical protein